MATIREARPTAPAIGASGIDFVLGVWLFISAFVWPHSSASQLNSWIVGALIAILAAWGAFVPRVRVVNSLLALWLFFSSIAITHVTGGSLWNNLIIAIIVFFVSLVPTGPAIRAGAPAPG